MRHMYRQHRKLSRARICQAVELAVALSHTPACCAFASRRVGWGEDDNGNLVYTPLERENITSFLVDDENQQPGQVHGSQSIRHQREQRLHMFMHNQSAAMTAAKEATAAVFGQGSQERDGWASAPSDAFGEAGSTQRRRGVPQGQIISSQQFRDSRKQQQEKAEIAALSALVQAHKRYRSTVQTLALNSAVEVKLEEADLAELTLPELKAFARARTGKAVTGKKEEVLAKAQAVKRQPVTLAAGEPPEGYAEWLSQQEEGSTCSQGSAEALIGRSVRKEFPGHTDGDGSSWFSGQITKYEDHYFTVEYEDGDSEQLSREEVDGIIEEAAPVPADSRESGPCEQDERDKAHKLLEQAAQADNWSSPTIANGLRARAKVHLKNAERLAERLELN